MKKVLVAPLDWGLGHATRCIPIIRELLKRNCDVYLAGSGDSLKLLLEEFPLLPSFSLPGYNPVYPTHGSMVWKMMLQLPKFSTVIKEEHRQIGQVVANNGIDILISDNRYGCWSRKIPTVFITHQTNIRLPNKFKWLTGMVRAINVKLIKRFSICWIPDVSGTQSLAGEMIFLNNSSIPVKHIGHLSRFVKENIKGIEKYDVTCVFSGPEPQRSALEKILREQLTGSGLRYLIVRGIIPDGKDSANSVANQIDFLNTEDLQTVLEQSSFVIARSGYSTLMDLARLGKKAIFIPTPGQTEQEYLADRLMKMGIAYSMTQDTFDLRRALEESKAFSGFQVKENDELLRDAMDEILDSGGKITKTN
ncbi:MAG: glycosyltransferase [Marivirga sp.]|nr:glycosyltransferase [Marivirga sp.]